MVGFSLDPSVSSRPPEVLSAASTTSISTRSWAQAQGGSGKRRDEWSVQMAAGYMYAAGSGARWPPAEPRCEQTCHCEASSRVLCLHLHERKAAHRMLPPRLRDVCMPAAITPPHQCRHAPRAAPAAAAAWQCHRRRAAGQSRRPPAATACSAHSTVSRQRHMGCSSSGASRVPCVGRLCRSILGPPPCSSVARAGQAAWVRVPAHMLHRNVHSAAAQACAAAEPPTGCAGGRPRSGSFQRRRTLSST